ncbi:MAG: imidazole glycerol phosphate synthase subunit HisH [Acidimicrobiales bacterium]
MSLDSERPLIAVLDYGIGNLRSAQKSLERVGADARLTSDSDLIADAAAVVLPGVGAFGRVVEAIHEAGLVDAAISSAASGRPFLGICVGMQAMYETSDESPKTKGLGIIPGRIRLLPDSVKRPQMQWNQLEIRAESDLLKGLSGSWMYFVHSYAVESCGGELPVDCVATCEYGGPTVAVIQRENVFATQFHPEKSGHSGLSLLANFVDLARASAIEKVLA